ncbi:MAG: LuxR C-terminal-related transcriptional regulator [Myxococcaceae bacterium]
MNSFFESTKLATENHSKSVKHASAVLLDYFNINNFYYYKITESGDFFLFDDNLGVVDFLDSQEFILKHPHYCHPKYHRNGCQIEKTNNNPLLVGLETTQDFFLKAKFNLSVSIVERSNNAVEEFGFHSSESSEEQSLFIFNHIDEIKLFSKWFLENNRPLLSFLQESKINLPQLLGDVFYSNRIQEADSAHLRREAFLKQLGIQAKPKLSLADQEVLRLTSRGFSPFQIGNQLHRSKRTIEHRIESLKQRLSCDSKVDLVEKAQEFERWGSI